MTTAPSEPPRDPPAKHIANPRRLLILTPTSHSLSTIPPLLHSLTGVPIHDPPQHETSPGTAPSQSAHAPSSTTSFAGYTTHSPLRLQTKYYTAEVPVWVDEIPLPEEAASQSTQDKTLEQEKENDTAHPGASQWRTEFLSAEADIVREAVGAFVVCALSPEPSANAHPGAGAGQRPEQPTERADARAVRDLMREVGAVKGTIDEERGGVGSVPGVLVLVGARKSGASAAPGAGGQDRDGLGLGGDGDGDGDGLGDELEDVPFSIPWWEDQLFDMGLCGWEVVEWDPAEQGGETRRNQYGGIYLPTTLLLPIP